MYLAQGVQNEGCVKRLTAESTLVPWQRFTLKSDQSPRALLVEDSSIKTFSSSNREGSCDGGLFGRHRKGVIRSLRWAVGDPHVVALDSVSLVVQWLVCRAMSMIAKSRRGLDGPTAFERVKGKPYRKKLPPFAENGCT